MSLKLQVMIIKLLLPIFQEEWVSLWDVDQSVSQFHHALGLSPEVILGKKYLNSNNFNPKILDYFNVFLRTSENQESIIICNCK